MPPRFWHACSSFHVRRTTQLVQSLQRFVSKTSYHNIKRHVFLQLPDTIHLQDMVRLRAAKLIGARLTNQAAAAAANICIAGFASSVMRMLDLSVAAADFASASETRYPLPLMLDTHVVTSARADKSRDGYHYFEQASELTDAAGVEVCVGNSVARVVARLVVKSMCPQTPLQL